MDPLDDWLGEVSDEDWGEGAAEAAERRSTMQGSQDAAVREEDLGREPPYDRPSAGARDRRAQVERRRIVAGLVLLFLVGVAAAAAVVMFRGGSDTTTTTTPSAAPTTTPTTPVQIPTETATSPSTTTPSTTTPSTTTPSTEAGSGFTLPEGAKLRRGEENDPAVVMQLQEALTAAGYEPGPADGTYGRGTEAAVAAFQEANGLSADGVVGPETAAALNEALQGA